MENPDLDQVLEEFNQTFQKLVGLPLKMDHDHKILLAPGTGNVNVQPYRYPTIKKDAIKRIVDEMLELALFNITPALFHLSLY